MDLKYESLAVEVLQKTNYYLQGKLSEDDFVESFAKYQLQIDAVKLQEAFEKNKNKPKMPSVDGYALNRLLSESDDNFTFDQELIECLINEDEDDWTEFLGWTVGVESEGFHDHDGQVVDYSVYFTSPDGHLYVVNDRHSLICGWDFDESIKFY